MKITKLGIPLVLLLGLCAGCSESTSQDKFTVAYLPVEDSTEIQTLHKEFEDDLSEAIGIPVESYQTTSYSAAVEAVTSGKVDMVQLTPFSYVVAEGKGGAHLIANAEIPSLATEDGYVSCLFAKGDSQIESVDDIKGKIMAFGDPASTTGHLIPKYYLMNEFDLSVDDIENNYFSQVLFSGGHDKTVLGVAQGTYEVGAAYCKMSDMLVEKGVIKENDVKVIGGAGKDLGIEISTTPVVARDGLDKELEEKLTKFLLSYENKDYFKGVGLEGGKYVKADDSLYDGIRKMADALQLNEEELLQ